MKGIAVADVHALTVLHPCVRAAHSARTKKINKNEKKRKKWGKNFFGGGRGQPKKIFWGGGAGGQKKFDPKFF